MTMASCAHSPFEVASFQGSLVNYEGPAMRPPWGSNANNNASSNTSSGWNNNPTPGHLARQMSLVGLDSCTRERIQQQQQHWQ
jgi:hypothetical protein